MNKFSKGIAAKINKINKIDKELLSYKRIIENTHNNNNSFSNFIKHCNNTKTGTPKKESKFKKQG